MFFFFRYCCCATMRMELVPHYRMEGASDHGVLIPKHTYFCQDDFVGSGMIGDNEVNYVDGVEYLPEQKPADVWTTFSPKIQSKITLRNTRLCGSAA